MNSLNIDNLYEEQMVPVNLENVINQNIPFSIQQAIGSHGNHVYLG